MRMSLMADRHPARLGMSSRFDCTPNLANGNASKGECPEKWEHSPGGNSAQAWLALTGHPGTDQQGAHRDVDPGLGLQLDTLHPGDPSVQFQNRPVRPR
jgi:hypothetical protein